MIGISTFLFRGEPFVVEAGSDFDIRQLTEESSFLNYENMNVSGKVDTGTPGIYTVSYSLGFVVWEKKVLVVDTTPPSVEVKDEVIQIRKGEEFDESKAIVSASDNTGKFSFNTRVTEGDLSVPGISKVEILAFDNFGNTTTKEVMVEVLDLDAPELVLNKESITLELGEDINFDSIVESATSKKGEVSLGYFLKEGSLQTAGSAVVSVVATDVEGVETIKDIPVKVEDHTPPVIEPRKDTVRVILGNKITPGSLLTKIFDNDGNPKLSTKVLSGNPEVPGNVDIEVTATDKSGNSSTANVKVFIKAPVYNNLGWDITGIDGQPYLVATNRVYNTVTVYGKDQNGDYSVPVKAICCSVGRSGCETPTGRWNTSTRYRWRLMVDDTYAQYAIRINGGIMFHSVPYYTMSESDMEYPEFNKLGSPASLGCIRMAVEDILWLYNNCPTGFPAIIYDDATSAGPLGKPEQVKINEYDELTRGWDPTDNVQGNPWK